MQEASKATTYLDVCQVLQKYCNWEELWMEQPDVLLSCGLEELHKSFGDMEILLEDMTNLSTKGESLLTDKLTLDVACLMGRAIVLNLLKTDKEFMESETDPYRCLSGTTQDCEGDFAGLQYVT